MTQPDLIDGVPSQVSSEPLGLLGADALAVLLGVTKQSIHVWRREGMPALERVVGRKKTYLFREDECRAWREAHKAEAINGGTRPGAGRPPKDAASVPGAVPLIEQQLEETKAELGAKLEELKQYEGANEILRDVRAGVLGRAEADTVRIGLDAAVKAIELERLKGSLIGRDQAGRAIRLALQRIRDICEQLPTTIAEIAAAQAPGVSRQSVRMAVEQALDRAWAQAAATGARELKLDDGA